MQAVLLAGDSCLFLGEFLPWRTAVLTARGLPAGVVTVGLDALAGVLGGFPRSQQLTTQARQQAQQAPDG